MVTPRFSLVDSVKDSVQGAVNSVTNVFGLNNTIDSPYYRAARNYAGKLVNTPFLMGWQWAITADDAPDDFDIFVKDVDFGDGSIDYDTFQLGSGSQSYPTFSNVSEITMTVRDTPALAVSKWFDAQLAKVKNKDGSVNLPKDYVFNLTVYILSEDLEKIELASFKVSAAKKGNYTLTREGVNEFISYPLTFQKFSSVGGKNL